MTENSVFGETWNSTLRFFRALGGVAENIEPREGRRGLFAVDPARPVELRIPSDLLVNIDDVEFVDSGMRLKAIANVMDAQRLFFEKYYADISWGRQGRTECAAFLAALETLPESVRAVLSTDFECEDLLEGDSFQSTAKQFLVSRSLRRGDSDYLVPLLDLANHDASGLPCQFEHGALVLRGETGDEVLVAFGVHDSLSAFRTLGVASAEPGAFSLPLRLTPRTPEVIVLRDTNLLERQGQNWIPQMSSADGHIELSCLMIGHARLPRLSRGIFAALMREAGYPDPDEAFDRILNFNWTRYLKLLEALEPYQGEMISTLRRMARYQLEAMSHCVGKREPKVAIDDRDRDVEKPPAEQVWEISIQ